MKIAIRLDDIAPGMDWGNFLKFKELLDAHDIKPLIGVVPDNKDPKLNISESGPTFWDLIRDLQKDGWVVAMHGFNHLYTTSEGGIFPLNKKSEFAGYDFETQFTMIQSGKKILESHGLSTDIFMAPSHSYDKNTLRALRENGFLKVTDGFGKQPYKTEGLTFYPISFRRADTLKDTTYGISTFVYHPNTMEEPEFRDLKKLLESGKAVSYSEFETFTPVHRGFAGRISERLRATLKRILVQGI